MNFTSAFARFLLPHRCLLCAGRTDETALCEGCLHDMPWLEQACERCALPLPRAGESLCGRCLRKPPSFDRCHAAFRYASPVDRLIGQLKNQRRLGSGQLLTRLSLDRLSFHLPIPPEADLITPVPLHWRRQLSRGFNQAAFIAELLASKLKLPLRAVASRRRATPKQQQLNRRQRLHNLGGVFHINAKAVCGRRVLLVDDVVTTGATAEALSQQLKRAGAKRVEIFALARTPAPDPA